MIRRIEIYAVAAEADPGAVSALERACRECGRFIPEVLYSRVGRNLSDVPVHLVWEHAFADPGAYVRYMVHRFHADVLDRYLLADSPERVVTNNDLGAGLVGYRCETPVFALERGVRRLLLLRLDGEASAAAVDRLTEVIGDAPSEIEEMTLSVVRANTVGPAWFDGVTPVGGRPRFTHVWEQGFTGVEALDAYRRGSSAWAEAERNGWEGWMNGIIERSLGIHYEIDGPGGFGVQGVQE